MNKTIEEVTSYDFGFSVSDDIPTLNDPLTHQKQIDDLKQQLQQMYDTIVPLLDNLCRDSDKPSIHWPDRVTKIEQYKKKLQKILQGSTVK